MSANAVNTLYTVAAGDSMSKIALRFYGDVTKYPVIAERNNLQPTAILMIGQRLIIPPIAESTTASNPVVTLPEAQVGPETVVVTASVWYKDWRYWAAIAAGTGLLIYFARKGLRSK